MPTTDSHTSPTSKYRFSSWHKQSGATRTAAAKKKSKMGTGPETLEHVSAFHDVCLSAFLSVCPRCCCSPCCCCCCCFICTYWARLYVSDIYHRYMFFQFSNVLSECSRARAPVRVGLKCLQCLPTGAWLTVVYRLSSNYIVYKSIYLCM